MPASNTLSSTTFQFPVGQFDSQVTLVSTANLTPGMRLYADREMLHVVRLAGYANLVIVRRGANSTAAMPHGTDVIVWMGNPDQFYLFDPQGQPPDVVLVSPWINALTGATWFALGDANAATLGQRYWVQQTKSIVTGATGQVQQVLTPTSST